VLNPVLGKHEVELMREGTVLISFLQPHSHPDLVNRLVERKITSFSMDLIPRIARAQKMDALSSQSTVAGYKAQHGPHPSHRPGPKDGCALFAEHSCGLQGRARCCKLARQILSDAGDGGGNHSPGQSSGPGGWRGRAPGHRNGSASWGNGPGLRHSAGR
jgi:hypothetical protein